MCGFDPHLGHQKTDMRLWMHGSLLVGLYWGRTHGKGSGNGSFPFGVTEIFRFQQEGGSPIERRQSE
ncbi:TPA: hypothetical protein DCR79_01670 [Patescibacteria group bacterium]|nr:hypothetical protein [Patescibacteria group bacterium]